jgi:leucyl aminopeptidase
MVNFVKKFDNKSDNLGFFVPEEQSTLKSSKVDQNIKDKVNKLLKTIDKNKDRKKIHSFDIGDNQKLFIIIIKKNLINFQLNNLGGSFRKLVSSNKNLKKISFLLSDNLKNEKISNEEVISEFLYGYTLKNYSFEKYKTKKKSNSSVIINICVDRTEKFNKEFQTLSFIQEGVFLTRDLISEPPNILNPKNYTKEILKLTKLGLKVEILNEKNLKKLEMNSLLGVGQGSTSETFLVVIKWNGRKEKDKPIAFVGKGVCFDTGGISLKPAKFMEEMKYDMGGSAVVVGLMKTLALRKAKVNAVGVVGLVENMPGANAQRPGDIVKSYSGKTIEILNTDAEGRLVLADALSYTEKKFKPKFIIDLATLTGAIIMALGQEYAGLFSNNDKLCKQLFNIGNSINEKVWRLPLHENYDKLMNSKYADVQNINYSGGAGSITAAQFLQRFIQNKTPWVHLDIAGMAFSKKASNINTGGATGFGVRLLNDLIKNFYE